MKQKMKILVAFMVLALVATLSVAMATSVSAQTTSDGFVYEVNPDGTTVTVTGYTGTANEIIIPSTINGKTVTDIGQLAFSTGDDYDLTTTKITIPNTVETIGDQAFMNKRAITEIIIPDSVVEIGNEAFFKCNKVTKLSIGANVSYIGYYAFGRLSSLTDLTVSAENMYFKVENDCLVDIVYKMVLVGEQVETVIIPDGIDAIDSFAFYGPGTAKGNIKKIVVSSGVQHIGESAFDCTAVEVLVLPKSVTYIGGALVANTALKPANNGGIPGNIYYEGTEEEWNGITINSYANAVIKTGATRHYGCCIADLVSYTHKYTNNTCDNICNNCNKLTRVATSEHTYVNNVCVDCGAEPMTKYEYEYTDYGDGTVMITKYNGNDTEINIPSVIDNKTVIAIGSYAFSTGEVYDTTTTKITIPNTVEYIGNNAFYNKRAITEIVIPDSVFLIDEEAFFKCTNVTKLTIGKNVTLVGARALARMHALEDIEIAEGNTSLEFIGGCLIDRIYNAVITTVNADEITIPEGIDAIGDCAFYLRNKLSSIVIPDGVTYIGENAFDGSSVSVVVIPKSVTTIVNAAFANTSNLASPSGHVYYEGTEEDYNNIDWVLSYVGTTQNNNIILDGRATKHFNSCMAAEDYVHKYQDGVCLECGAGEVEAPYEFDYVINPDGETVTVTGYNGTSNEIIIPSTINGMTVTAIGSYAFSGGEEYDYVTTKISIPDTVETIGEKAFYNLRAITEITIPDSVVSVGNGAFFKCINVTKLTIGKNLTLVGDKALARMHALEEIEIAEGNTALEFVDGCLIDIAKKAVITTVNIDNIVIPDGIEIIADCAFYLRTNLSGIVIPEGVTYIGENAFDGSSVSYVVIPKSVKTIVNAAFANTDNLFVPTGHVYYEGTKAEYDAINWVLSYVGTTQNNNIISDERATKHFESCMISSDYTHKYGGDCDSTCNECEKTTRTVAMDHIYDYDCDKECNVCGDKRNAKHIYDNAEDLICNACGQERPPYVIGDIDGEEGVTDSDAVYLLFHTYFPEDYAVDQPVDYDGDGTVTDSDAVYLLFHTFFPEDYPL